MPELPDITLYVDALTPRVVGRTLQKISIRGPSLLRTVEPPIDDLAGRRVERAERRGKRILLALEGGPLLAIHLMIAGRLLWKDSPTPPSRIEQARFTFSPGGGTLVLSEAGTRKRAMLHALRGPDQLPTLGAVGLEPLEGTPQQLSAALRRTNRTIKRALTDPATLSGIGNAYSDEILHAARLSPILLTSRLTDEQAARLHESMRRVLLDAIARLRRSFAISPAHAGRFPGAGDITAFRPEFAVHGKYARPCPVCASPVQRLVRADNEVNYCATCQTQGQVLADRSLSRLLRDDWPRTIEEWEGLLGPGTGGTL